MHATTYRRQISEFTQKTETFLVLTAVRGRFGSAPTGPLQSPEATTCLSPYPYPPADALEETPAVGSAAVPGRINPMTDRAPASITQTRRPIIHRLGAGKNARAPADALEIATTVGSAAVPGRINPSPRSYTSFDHPNPPPDL